MWPLNSLSDPQKLKHVRTGLIIIIEFIVNSKQLLRTPTASLGIFSFCDLTGSPAEMNMTCKYLCVCLAEEIYFNTLNDIPK